MNKQLIAIALMSTLASFAGCKGGGPDGETFGGNNTGTGTDTDGGPDDDEDDGPGPTITFVAPTKATDPNDDEVLISSKVTVRCRVVRGSGIRATDVDPSTVKIFARDPETDKMLESSVKALEDSQYESKFDIGDFSNGSVEFDCRAGDVDGNTKTKTLTTLLDLGPSIEILDPKNGSIRALKSATSIQFRVKPSKLTSDDGEAAVKKIDLKVAGVAVGFKEVSPQLYQTSVNFQDEALFGSAPDAAEVVVTATNARTPEAAKREAVSKIKIDSSGPAITIMNPVHLSIVRATVEIAVTITDPAGIEPDSVVASINNDEKLITKWSVSDNVYKQTFDTRDFDKTLSQLTINVRAFDTVGNMAIAPVIVRLDNVGPRVSMDPPWIRESKLVDGKKTCSAAYDPLWDATDDGDTVAATSLYRAAIVDETNYSKDQTVLHAAGIAADKVQLYAQGDPSVPLLLDKDGNGTCDEINFEDQPLPIELDFQQIMSPKGVAWYDADANFNDAKHMAAGCNAPAESTMVPKALCGGTSASRFAAYKQVGFFVWALSPGNDSDPECAGAGWELQAALGTGWKCLAVRAEDNIGNVGVSRPLRVCVGGGCAGPAPSCRKDSCGQPPDFPANYVYGEVK